MYLHSDTECFQRSVTRELLDILTDDGWLKNEYHGEEEIFTGLASLNDLVRLAAAMGTEFPLMNTQKCRNCR